MPACSNADLVLEELLLKAAMGQGERQVMVEQDFHF